MTTSPPPQKKRWKRWLGRGLLALIVLLVLAAGLIYSLIWMPGMQQRLLHRFTTELSEEWIVVFRIDSVAMHSWSHVHFYGFYLEDPSRDTLLQVDAIEFQGFDVPALWNKRIDVEKATLEQTVFKLQRTPQQRYFSLDFVIDYFHKEEPLPKEERFKFNIDTAIVRDIRYVYADATTGTTMKVWAPEVYTHAQSMNLIGKWVRLDTAYAHQARVFIETTDPIPIADSVPPSPYKTLPPEDIPPWSLRCAHLVLEDLTYYSTETFSKQAEHYELVQQNKKGRDELDERLKRRGVPWPEKTLKQKNNALRAHNHRENRDLNNLHFRNINLRVDSASLEDQHYLGYLRELSAQTPSGFNFVDIRMHFDVAPTKTVFKNLYIQTEESAIGNAVVLHYDGYHELGDFFDQVEVAVNLEDCHFTLADIGVFVPEIMDQVWAKLYKNTVINVRGTFQGYLKHFNLDNFDIELGKEDIVMDKDRAAKKTPVEWLARTFGPNLKRKAEREQRRAERKKARAQRRAARQGN